LTEQVKRAKHAAVSRPDGTVSRTKVTALLGALWTIGARVAGVPETVVDAGTTLAVAAAGIFLRDAR
jgi:hypothetical protein